MKAKNRSIKTDRSTCAAGANELTIRVIQPKERQRFDELLDAKHYLGQTRSVGDFLRQVVERDGKWIALLAWGPACLHIKDRDHWIGWNRLQRAERAILCGATLDKEHRAAETPATSGVLPLNQGQMKSLLYAFLKTPDPRAKNTRFRLPSVLTIVAMSLLCGKRDLSQFHRFGWRLRQNQRALIGLPLKKGNRKIREIPSYSVYYNVLSNLDLDKFATVLNDWLKERAGELPGALAIDGKMVRDCIGVVTLADHDTGVPHSAHIMSQKEGEGRNCEMRVAQRLIDESGNLAGKVVTGDALHAQRAISRQIVEHGGEYMLRIKNNQSSVQKHSAAVFAGATPLLP
jgi:hypothetical protein